MDTYDKLVNYEVLIKKCEYRTQKEDFNNILHISHQIIEILEVNDSFLHHQVRLKKRHSEVSGFAGTSNRDLATIRAFDYYKRTLLNIVKRAKRQILDLELEV